MITYIEIDGFKSFRNYKAEFSPFVIIAGTNGSGKSNLFDAFRLISNLTDLDLKTAFNEQRGDAIELFTRYPDDTISKEIRFHVELLVDKKIKDSWGGEVVLKYTRLRYILNISRVKTEKGFDRLRIKHEELTTIKSSEDKWVKKYIPQNKREFWRPKVKTGKRGIPYISTTIENDQTKIQLHQDGKRGGKPSPASEIEQTVLSGVNSVDFSHAFAAKEEMKKWKFLQLNPEKLREPSKKRFANDNIASDGSNLAAALYRIKSSDEFLLGDISRELNNLLPSFIEVDVEEDNVREQFIIIVKTEDGRKFTSKVLSEGTLRLLTLCTLKYDDNYTGVLNFEEPENGVHPYRLKFVTKLLQGLSTDFYSKIATEYPLRQVITNTHSPVLVREIFNNQKNFTSFFAILTTVIIPGKKIKMKTTKMLPITKGDQLELDYGINGSKEVTLAEVTKYLKTADFEEITNQFSSK